MEKLGEKLFRLGNIIIDTEKREIRVPGRINPGVTVLEFVANTKGGSKAYESAVELETDAVTFNLALILIGLDQANGVPAKFPFDPDPPQGDPVEIWVEWVSPKEKRRIRAEELVYNRRTQETLPKGSWVYTGSAFLPDGRYLADVYGVLISFAHNPATVVDSPLPDGVTAYGTSEPPWTTTPVTRR